MSGQIKYPRVEDAIVEILDDDLRENALLFAAYLNENQLSPISLPYEMDHGKTIGFKIPYNGHYLGWVLIKEKGEWCVQIFNLKKPCTTTSKFVVRPVMMNAGELKMLKFSEKSLKACVLNIPTIL